MQNSNSCQLALSGNDEESHNYFKKTKAEGFTLREKRGCKKMTFFGFPLQYFLISSVF